MSNIVTLVAYDDNWPDQFEAEAERIRVIAGANSLSIHHIGSTAIPGLIAKPIIDILSVVENLKIFDTCILKLEQLGYTSKGEYGLAGRRYFEKKNFHIHVYRSGDPSIDRHIHFRDYLRTHREECNAYADLKIELASQFAENRRAYQAGKQAFIQRIEKING